MPSLGAVVRLRLVDPGAPTLGVEVPPAVSARLGSLGDRHPAPSAGDAAEQTLVLEHRPHRLDVKGHPDEKEHEEQHDRQVQSR